LREAIKRLLQTHKPEEQYMPFKSADQNVLKADWNNDIKSKQLKALITAYQNVLEADWNNVDPNQIEALINELSQIFYQLQCATDLQVSVKSLDQALLAIYQKDVAAQPNKQPSPLANLIFPPLAVQLDQGIRVHEGDDTLSTLLQALELHQMTHNEVLVNHYIPKLFDANVAKIKPYTPLRKLMFLATLRLLIELNRPQDNQAAPNVLEGMGYTWDAISRIIVEGHRQGLALLKCYYELRLSGKRTREKIPKGLSKIFAKPDDPLVKILWDQIQPHGASQIRRATFGKRQRRIPLLKYGWAALVLALWVIVIGLLGIHTFNYIEHTETLQQQNHELLTDLKKNANTIAH
jgi:hypothetical protein